MYVVLIIITTCSVSYQRKKKQFSPFHLLMYLPYIHLMILLLISRYHHHHQTATQHPAPDRRTRGTCSRFTRTEKRSTTHPACHITPVIINIPILGVCQLINQPTSAQSSPESYIHTYILLPCARRGHLTAAPDVNCMEWMNE